MYKSYFLSISILLILATVGVASTYDDLEIVVSSDSEFHFKLINQSNLGNLERLEAGETTSVFARTIQVGVPFGARVRLAHASGTSLSSVSSDGAVSISQELHDLPLVTVKDPQVYRGRQVVSIAIAPIRGTSVYEQVEVRLVFEGGLAAGAGEPANDPIFDRIFKATLANYDQFRSWPVQPRPTAKLLPAGAAFSLASEWIKISVVETGLHAITGAQLAQAGLSLDDLRSDSIRIFNAGGRPLEVENEQARPTFDEIAIRVEDGNDGLFGSSDRILFYGEAVDRLLYREGYPPRFMNNPYAVRNVYWLAVSGDFAGPANRIATRDVAPTGLVDTVVTSVWRRSHAEEDNLLFTDGGGHTFDYYNWYWTDQDQLTIYVASPGAVTGDSAQLVLRGNTGNPGYMDVMINGDPGQNRNCNSNNCLYSTRSLVDGLNTITLTLYPNGSTRPYFDFLDLLYPGRLVVENNRVDFVVNVSASDMRAQIQLEDGFSSAPVLFEIDDPLQPVELTGFQRSSGQVTFESDLIAGGLNRFYGVALTAAVSPESFELTNPVDLRLPSPQADLIVIAPEQFQSALDRWTEYRESQGYAISFASVSDITDNFAYGLNDPTAIRDYLKHAYETWPAPAPTTVMLVGDANYDFCNALGTGVPNYVPVYIHSLISRDKSFSDDNYVYFGDYGLLDSDSSYWAASDRGMDMVCSRWPVTDVTEIETITDKVIAYESELNLGSWRTDITAVADDEYSGGSFDGSLHTLQADTLLMFHVPRVFTPEKIYLWEYPKVNRLKPDVNQAIINAINRGTLAINYVGHGNPDVWAHEYVLHRASDLPKLTNQDRLPLVYAASCAIGSFDDPLREGMAEDFLSMPTGGAVAVIAATRLVYSTDNAALNRKVFDQLFENTDLSIAEALYAAKLQRQIWGDGRYLPVQNDRAFNCFGDPCLKLGVPEMEIVFSTYPDSLSALGRSRVTGFVADENGDTLKLDGRLVINVYDTDRQKAHGMDNGTIVHYDVVGPTIFGGSATVVAGAFEVEFITPLDVGFGGQGARISAYAVLDSVDAAGLVDGIAISDSITVSNDSIGPVIEYSFAGRSNFISGDVITSEEELVLVISDSSGINLAGGLGHGISLELDGLSENTIMLNDHFQYNQDDYTTGGLSYRLEDISTGNHTFKIKAWDNANNSSTVSFIAEAVSDTLLAINDLMNYPNPMRDETAFYFELTQAVDEFHLEIFTVSGKKIRSFNRFGLNADNYPNGSFDIRWNGLDADGDRVATGIYIYKATAQSTSGGDVESFGKIVVIN